MPNIVEGVERRDVLEKINILMENLINIKDESGEFLLKLADGRTVDTKGWNGWDWTHGIGLFGIYRFYAMTGDRKALSIIKKWFEDRFREGTVSKNVNTSCVFLTLAHLYEDTGDRTYLPYLDRWFEWVSHEMPRTEENGIQHITYDLRNEQQLWDDTLMMTVLPLAKTGIILNRQSYVEDAKKQFLLHTKYLSDKKTGLWFHGWSFLGRHNFGEVLWARGNCWITIAIPEFIEMTGMKSGDPVREFLLDALRQQVKALAKLQDKSGLWHTVLNDPSSYLESSASAGFCYGILKAVRKRYIDKEYEKVGFRAIQAILGKIGPDGELGQVSFGTPVFWTAEEYKAVPLTAMPYGQALAILCLSEFLNYFI
jgi:unsaturated rhamnogalacturonyl hydrolase